jgi:hypothetical protein
MLYKIASVNDDGSLKEINTTVQDRAEENSALRKGWREKSKLKEPKIEVWLLTVLKPFYERWGWLFKYPGGLISGIVLMALKDIFFRH